MISQELFRIGGEYAWRGGRFKGEASVVISLYAIASYFTLGISFIFYFGNSSVFNISRFS